MNGQKNNKNTSCICTVIKNEHDYLDEFIKYHIELGIDHIFIFEDVNSKSHHEITDKYPLYTTLIPIESIVDKKQIDNYITHDFDRQNIYNVSILKYLKRNYNFKWCFNLDVDEFITIPYGNIYDILREFESYEAIMIKWQNYNANGHIFKPDYTKGGLQKTYTQTCGMSPHDHPYSCFKILFNLDSFNLSNFFSVHGVSCQANALRLDNYDIIFLRHYITKSWEEYVWKLKSRGMFNSGHRNFEHFFDFNPDLKSQRGVLMESLEE